MRTFIALQIPREIKSQISRCRKSVGMGEFLNWVAPDSLHMTLKFLGDTDESKIVDIERILGYISKNTRPQPIQLKAGGIFPKRGEPRIFWAGIMGSLEWVEQCANQCEEGFQELGFEKEERQFRPHVTVARLKKNHPHQTRNLRKQFCTLMSDFESQKFCPSEIQFMKSELKPTGAVYHTMATFALRFPE